MQHADAVPEVSWHASKPASASTLADLAPLQHEMTQLRREFHRIPELAFEESKTSAKVLALLTTWGYQVTTGIAGTGLVATLQSGEGSRSIGIRADLDALPIVEANTFEHVSQHPGRMHACGHDGHLTMLLGAAKQLAATRRFNGTVHLIFQPAEERGFDSGAKRMVDEGLFERFPCDAVFAMHNHPGRPTGQMMFRAGEFMAAGDRVFITLKGIGGHAARPHLAKDPVVAAASLIMALQTVVSRNVDPSQTAVVTVGKLQGGQALNVIPSQVELGLSVRSFDPAVRALLKARIIALTELQASSFGVQAEINYVEGYPIVVNAAAETALAIAVAKELIGAENVVDHMEQLTGSEDFAYMLQACPGSLVRIGNGPADAGSMLHNPHYDFNDANLTQGAAFWCRLVERFLESGVEHYR